MPIELEWYTSNRIIHGRYPREITLHDLTTKKDVFLALLDSGSPPVHFVIDLSALEILPLNLGSLRQTLEYLRHPNLGWVVTYGNKNNQKIEFLANLITQFYGIHYLSFDTLQAALDHLYSVDASLAQVK